MANKADKTKTPARGARSKREKLHRLVDELPAREVEAAMRYVSYLRSTVDPGMRSLLEAPYDDEPLTEEDKTAIQEGLADFEAGRVFPLEEVKREFGL